MAVQNSLARQDQSMKLSVYLQNDAVKKQINQVVGGKNGTRFISSIVSAVQSTPALQECRGIQRRFWAVLSERRSKTVYGEYWLLKPEECKGLVKVSLFSDVQPTNEDSLYRKESKVKKSNVYKGAFSDSSLESAFQFYLLVRSQNWGEISEEQVNALREDLLSLSSDLAEQKAILNKAAAGGWKNLYPVQSKRRPKTKKQPEKQGKFKNFEEREYEDMTDLTRKLMQR